MSRWLTKDKDGNYQEGIISMDECRWLIEEVCCNDRSDMCCDFPHPDYCSKICPLYTDEDGIVTSDKTSNKR